MSESNPDREVVQSPCISVCSLDENDVCLGCFRDLSEIGGWGKMDDAEKGEVLRRAAAREKASGTG